MLYDLVVEYHTIFYIFLDSAFCNFLFHFRVKNTNSTYVQPAIPNTALVDYIIPSKKSFPFVCQERLFIATNIFPGDFDKLQHISKVLSFSGEKKTSPFVYLLFIFTQLPLFVPTVEAG